MIKKPCMVPATRALGAGPYDFYPLGSPLALLTRPLVPRSTAVRPLPTPVPLPLPPQVMPLAALRAQTFATSPSENSPSTSDAERAGRSSNDDDDDDDDDDENVDAAEDGDCDDDNYDSDAPTDVASRVRMLSDADILLSAATLKTMQASGSKSRFPRKIQKRRKVMLSREEKQLLEHCFYKESSLPSNKDMQVLVEKIGRRDFQLKNCRRWFANQRVKEAGGSGVKAPSALGRPPSSAERRRVVLAESAAPSPSSPPASLPQSASSNGVTQRLRVSFSPTLSPDAEQTASKTSLVGRQRRPNRLLAEYDCDGDE